jgi:hypothetical protein
LGRALRILFFRTNASTDLDYELCRLDRSVREAQRNSISTNGDGDGTQLCDRLELSESPDMIELVNAMGTVRKHYQGRVIRRTASSLDRSGNAILKLAEPIMNTVLLELSQWELDIISQLGDLDLHSANLNFFIDPTVCSFSLFILLYNCLFVSIPILRTSIYLHARVLNSRSWPWPKRRRSLSRHYSRTSTISRNAHQRKLVPPPTFVFTTFETPVLVP